jgi:hypothetical protein
MDEDSRNVLVLRRCLKLLNGILKEFANIKMLNGVKTMAKVRYFHVLLTTPINILQFTDRWGPSSRALQLLFTNVLHYIPKRRHSAIYWFDPCLR